MYIKTTIWQCQSHISNVSDTRAYTVKTNMAKKANGRRTYDRRSCHDNSPADTVKQGYNLLSFVEIIKIRGPCTSKLYLITAVDKIHIIQVLHKRYCILKFETKALDDSKKDIYLYIMKDIPYVDYRCH